MDASTLLSPALPLPSRAPFLFPVTGVVEVELWSSTAAVAAAFVVAVTVAVAAASVVAGVEEPALSVSDVS